MGRGFTCLLALGFAAGLVHGQEVTLRGISTFNPGTTYSVHFESFVKRVNERGKGQIQIRYLGGGSKVMDPFEMGGALRGGVVDIGNLSGTFSTNIIPEADALKMITATVSGSGGAEIIKLLNEIYAKRSNARILGRQKTLVPFHLYLNNRPKGMDLTGLKLRVTPIYAPFFAAMGATGVRIAPGEIFTALERGVVDGYGWPLQGIFDLGWQDATKFRVDPGFYSSVVEVVVNLAKWNALNPSQKAVIEEAAAWMEKSGDIADQELNKSEDERQRKQGIQVITLQGEERARYLKMADDSAWEAIVKASPEYGPRLKQLVAR